MAEGYIETSDGCYPLADIPDVAAYAGYPSWVSNTAGYDHASTGEVLVGWFCILAVSVSLWDASCALETLDRLSYVRRVDNVERGLTCLPLVLIGVMVVVGLLFEPNVIVVILMTVGIGSALRVQWIATTTLLKNVTHEVRAELALYLGVDPTHRVLDRVIDELAPHEWKMYRTVEEFEVHFPMRDEHGALLAQEEPLMVKCAQRFGVKVDGKKRTTIRRIIREIPKNQWNQFSGWSDITKFIRNCDKQRQRECVYGIPSGLPPRSEVEDNDDPSEQT